jgi:hypothetical protein
MSMLSADAAAAFKAVRDRLSPGDLARVDVA